MKNLILLLALILISTASAQQLPLQIGNQWHYDVSAVPGGTNYAAIAVDTVTINNKIYYKMERRDAYTGELLGITYDRLEGDSAYYRYSNGQDSIIINFNWQVGYTRVTSHDSCLDFNILSYIGTRNVWGFNTDSYHFQLGEWCTGFEDTAWVLFSPEIVRKFGCYWAGDGRLVGALIDSVVYGTLYPLPVELTGFSASLEKNNVILHWNTASEVNNKGFEVQRSAGDNNQTMKTIGFVSGHGTITEPQQYSFIDKSVKPGMYQYRLKQIDFDDSFNYSNIVEVKVDLTQGFSLSQNYPNPFNPATVIRYIIDKKQFVSLKIYNILGKEVATLVNEEKPAGEYTVEFDGSSVADGLPSGIYFYQLRTANYTETKKMTLLK
jgi:hypothetical protein